MADWSADLEAAFQQYVNGPRLLRDAIQGLNERQLSAPAPPGRWNVLQNLCHIADFEIIYADRMKRVLAEERPMLLSGDPDVFAAGLAYDRRRPEDELAVIESVRRQTALILAGQPPARFERLGVHSTDGPVSVATLLKRVANHIPHHVQFILQKRPVLESLA